MSVFFTAITQLLLAFTYIYWFSLCLLMFAYFIAFNILEASLPSLVSKQADPSNKGTAMGIYSTGQFLGIFAGGILAGILYEWKSSQAIFIANAILSFIWFIVACYMKPNSYLSTLILHYKNSEKNAQSKIDLLLAMPGIKEVVFAEEEHVFYLRVDKEHYISGSAERTLKL